MPDRPPLRPAALRRDYRLHVQIGAVLALLLTLAAFSVPTPPEAPAPIVETPPDPFVMLEIPPSDLTPPPPPPPPAPPPPIQVSDDREIVDEAVESLDIDFGDAMVPTGPPAPPLAPPPPPHTPIAAPPPPPDAFVEEEVLDFVPVENQPVLIGGLDGLQRRVVYPEIALRAGVSGTVFVRFVVDEEGRVVDPEIVRSPNDALSRAALTAVRESAFEPGTQRGRAVKVRYSLPIRFILR